MKKITSIIAVAIFALVSINSCQKEAEVVKEDPVVKEPVIMRVNAGTIETKTYVFENGTESVDGKDKTVYGINWSEGDAIAAAEVSMVSSVATIQPYRTSSALAANAPSASFEVDLTENEGSANFSYIFVYPASRYSQKAGDVYRGEIPAKQTFASSTFDKTADLLVSRAITGLSSRPVSVTAEFERIGATVLMNVKAPTTTEKIRKITFSTTEDTKLQGYYEITPLTGAHETSPYYGGKSIELTPAAATTYTGTIPVWFRCSETTLSDNFTVVVTTNKKIYTKEIDLAAAGRTIEFHNSGLTIFNVNMSSVVGVDNPYVEDGPYYIVAKYSGNYFALSSTANGTRLDKVQLDDFDPSATSYLSSNSAVLWNVTNEDDQIYITSSSSKYLNAGTKTASTSATKQYFTVATGSTSGTLRLNSVSQTGYGLRYNTGGPYFAFYNSDPSASMIADVYFMPKDTRTRVSAPENVDAEASGTTITVIWDDASDTNIDHYLVKLSGTATASQTVDVGEENYEFTGLADGTYAVSVEAVPADDELYLNSLPATVSGLVIGSVSNYSLAKTLTAGQPYLIVELTDAKVATGAFSSSTLQATSVSISGGNSITATDTIDGYVFTIAAIAGEDGYYSIKFGSNYIGYSGSGTNLSTSTTIASNNYKWSIEVNSTTGEATILNKGTSSRYLGYNGSSGFKAYSNGSGYGSYRRPYLFKK